MFGWFIGLFKPVKSRTWTQGRFTYTIDNEELTVRRNDGEVVAQLPYASKEEKQYVDCILEFPELLEAQT